MLETFDTERFRRALVPVIAVVFGLAVLAAAATAPSDQDPGRPDAAQQTPDASTTTAPGAAVTEVSSVPADGEPAPTSAPPPTTGPLGPAVVPAPGVYRYDVDEVRDGEASTRSEEREISVLGEEDGATIVQLVASSDGERQASVLAWSPDQVQVRSTQIETEGAPARDCSWAPPFLEFGRLENGGQWTVESTCTTDVAGLPTTFVVRGASRVVGEAEVVHAGAPARVWQVARDRTTTITATVGNDAVEQVVREVGTFFIDPARGLTLRSDVTVTLSGAQQGESRRTSVLVEG